MYSVQLVNFLVAQLSEEFNTPLTEVSEIIMDILIELSVVKNWLSNNPLSNIDTQRSIVRLIKYEDTCQ